jgi:hypothetical protein
MTPRPSPIRLPAHRQNAATESQTTVKELERAAQLLEDLIQPLALSPPSH